MWSNLTSAKIKILENIEYKKVNKFSLHLQYSKFKLFFDIDFKLLKYTAIKLFHIGRKTIIKAL